MKDTPEKNQNIEGAGKGLASASFLTLAAGLWYADNITQLPEATVDIAAPMIAIAGLALTHIFAKEVKGTAQYRPFIYGSVAAHLVTLGIVAAAVSERSDNAPAETTKELKIEQTPVEAAAKAFVWQPV